MAGAAPSELASLRAEAAKRLERVLSIRRSLESLMPALARDYDETSLKLELPGRKPLTISPGYLAEYLREGTPDGFTHVQLGLLERIRPVAPQLARRHAKVLEEFARRRRRYDGLTQELTAAAGGLLETERSLYDSARGTGPVPPQAAKPPCAQFSL